MKPYFLIILTLLFIGCQQNNQKAADNRTNSSSPSSISNTSTSAEVLPVKILESAYHIDSGFGDNYLKWVVILENPNPSFYGLFPTITITARDESGNIVGTEDQVLMEFPPNTKLAFAGQISLTNKPKTVDFGISKVNWKNTVTKPSDYIPFPVNKVTTSSSGKNSVTVAGDISNPYPKDIEQLAVTSLLRDESGKLIGGNTTFVDAVSANGSRPYSDKYVSINGKPNKTEVFVMPWGSSSWNKIVAEK